MANAATSVSVSPAVNLPKRLVEGSVSISKKPLTTAVNVAISVAKVKLAPMGHAI